jgi:phage protein D
MAEPVGVEHLQKMLKETFIYIYLGEKYEALSDDYFSLIQSVTYEDTALGSNLVTIIINDPDFFILDNINLFIEEQPIKVIGGYKEDFRRFNFEGYVSLIDIDISTSNAPQLTITCMDKTHVMNREEKTRAWKNVLESDVAIQIFHEYGLIPCVDNTEDIQDNVSQSNQTDIAFLTQLAQNQADDYVCYVEGKYGYFKKKDLTQIPQTTIYYGIRYCNLLSFSPRLNKESKKTKVRKSDINLKTGKIDVGIITEQVPRTILGRPVLSVDSKLDNGERVLADITGAVDSALSGVSGIISGLSGQKFVPENTDEETQQEYKDMTNALGHYINNSGKDYGAEKPYIAVSKYRRNNTGLALRKQSIVRANDSKSGGTNNQSQTLIEEALDSDTFKRRQADIAYMKETETASDNNSGTQTTSKAKYTYLKHEQYILQGDATIIPDPKFRAREMVRFENLGAVLTGNYYVDKMLLEWDSSSNSFTQTITVSKNGVGDSLKVGLVPHVAPTPVKTNSGKEPVAKTASATTYTVTDSDTLWGLAVKFYGDGNKYPIIYDANKNIIGGNPNVIVPGQVLTIPK